ncbi:MULTISPECIES: MurR/RpiR family transcriptional regulator [Staphylococcus]|jgi:DNA-binding MurR/RpiR family transcriptional regulator|uniref:MurR/RpiR family transcriptional regulator n=2 Tax=Staphylococcus nepalensis TaxID=214473 RepID=A0ABS3L2F6_9STAP|nr:MULTISPECIES: MurR/RpiR family transcriptional regulator [Staphylococcus]MBO1206251.1 MurR/RpiR family transcriptional regulator [Staphylococcus nepalensis]MBO1212258.1 MurR/RpiR family transcriptional regulator [Staphylococcus nepalensis]MBO1217105.1 MurR/RpiR family transcriptional regulator [Staphylococcus nepalensis]MBO1222324.1 MurR/RpiR family transcriptional regulator [Staphylococcus nepalensis]MBO1227735.1 MurR/RpiR family transcriptional regulator [Staphylococcus nepalensis]
MVIRNTLILLESSLTNLNPSEYRVAQYVIDHPHETINSSIQHLANLTNVSEATIVRLSKKIKCKGFQDLKMKIAMELNNANERGPDYDELNMNYSKESVINSISQSNIKSIKNTAQILSPEELEQAILILNKARKICVFGIGASSIIAEDLKQKLTRIDKWCEVGKSYDEQATLSANLTNEDVVIAISNTGQTEDMIQSLSLARDKGSQIISITKYSKNYIADLANINLFFSSVEKPVRSAAMSSRIAMLNVIDILFISLASRNYERYTKLLENTRQAVKVKKRKY